MKKICSEWNLTNLEVKKYFETATPFMFDSELNTYDIYHCEFVGLLLFEGKQRKYSINLGGSGFIYDATMQQGFGCRKGKCLEFIYSDE